MEQEIEHRRGPWGEQTRHRHGTQPGYGVFHGRKVPIQRPRLGQKGDGETALASYQLFQQDGRMRRAVARKLLRQGDLENEIGQTRFSIMGFR
jgi:hypothetical protein